MELERLYDCLSANEKNYIYGAGYVGQLLYEWCMDQGISIQGFVTSDAPNVNIKEGLPVLQVKNIEDKERACIVIAAKAPLSYELYNKASTFSFQKLVKLDEETISKMEERRNAKRLIRNQMMYPVDNLFELENKKILVIAPHPDDEVIGCGGMLALYANNCDVLCINSSGVKYEWNEACAEEIAIKRIEEFEMVMALIGVEKSWIAKIWGIPPMFEGIERNLKNYISEFDFSLYDCIFIPHISDGHREHRYVATVVLPHILKQFVYKEDLKIISYEVWSTMPDPNFYLDISSCHEKKKRFINEYKSRKKGEYAKRILALNQYRGIISRVDYAEAYKIIPVKTYLDMVSKKRGDSFGDNSSFEL